MDTDDQTAAVDAALDTLFANPDLAAGSVAAEDLAMLRHLHDRWRQPSPDPAFVRRLGTNLASLHGRTPIAAPGAGAVTHAVAAPLLPAAPTRPGEPWALPRRARRIWFATAALAVCVALIGAALLGRGGDRRETIPAGAVASPPSEGRAVVLLIDVSGSMSYDPLGGAPKIEMAQEAARIVIDGLEPGTLLGILTFNEEQTWVYPLAPMLTDADRANAVAAVDELTAAGGSRPVPALRLGIETLRSSDRDEKLLIVLSDDSGRLDDSNDYRDLIHDVNVDDDVVTVLSIIVGAGVEPGIVAAVSSASGGESRWVWMIEDIPAAVEYVLGLAAATPEPDRNDDLPGVATPDLASPVPDAIRSTAVAVSITVYADYLLRGDDSTEAAAVEQIEAALAPFAAAGCRIGFIITEAEAPSVGAGTQIADAVNALLRAEFPDLVGGAGFYSVANVGEPSGRVELLLFPFDDCAVS